MATPDSPSSGYIRALPTLSRAAELIDVSPAGVTRGIEELGLEPIPWGRREKHLGVEDLLRLAAHLRRASVEEVAGGLLEVVERDHPEQVDAINAGIDSFFDSLPSRHAEQSDRFVAELREALPERYAKRAEAIYLRHAASS
ncbi:MAG TPA: hypothetical protein VGB13_05710 [Candidatus Krumholzibacteria bacterium]